MSKFLILFYFKISYLILSSRPLIRENFFENLSSENSTVVKLTLQKVKTVKNCSKILLEVLFYKISGKLKTIVTAVFSLEAEVKSVIIGSVNSDILSVNLQCKITV